MLKPKKRLGQNFLTSQKVINKVIESSNLDKNDIVLEIGPGFGALTFEIAKRVKKVIAVEKDTELASKLNIKNVEIINKDILDYEINLKDYKLISNLPYNISLAVIKKFLEDENQPQEMIIMLQKEVAQRICAKPPKMSKPAVFTQFYAIPKIISYISKEVFFPKPKVDSAILKISDIQKRKIDISNIVNAGFSHKRKTLLNNLSKELDISKEKTKEWLRDNNIESNRRAESLTVDNWINLKRSFLLL